MFADYHWPGRITVTRTGMKIFKKKINTDNEGVSAS